MPACVTRMMGPARGDPETASVHEKLLSLFQKAGYEVIYPEVLPRRTAPTTLTRATWDAATIPGAVHVALTYHGQQP